MQNNIIDRKIVDEKLEACGIQDMEDATIRDIVKVVNMVEAESGTRFIRMEMGVPGLPPTEIGINAEIEALRGGCAQFYPMLEGHKEFKTEGSRFVKNFVDIDIKPEGIIPTVGSMQACFAAFMAVTECKKGKNTVLFIDPGFPVQKTQMQVIGKPYKSSGKWRTSTTLSCWKTWPTLPWISAGICPNREFLHSNPAWQNTRRIIY